MTRDDLLPKLSPMTRDIHAKISNDNVSLWEKIGSIFSMLLRKFNLET